MPASFLLTRVFGIDIRVHATFFLALLFGAYQWGSMHGAPGAVFGAVATACLFVCVVLHELGHSLVAVSLKVPVREILLLPIGGVAQMTRRPEKPSHELLIAIAGPLVNVVIALVLGLAALLFPGLMSFQALIDGRLALDALLAWLLMSNIVLAVFNMVPALPMDGGRVLRAVLSMLLGPMRATRIAALVGRVAAVGMITVGLFTQSLMLPLIGIFIFFAAGREEQAERARASLGNLSAGQALNPHALRVLPGDRVIDVAQRALLTAPRRDVAVVLGDELLGVLDFPRLLLAAQQEPQAFVAGVMRRDVPRMQSSGSLDDAQQLMRAHGLSSVAVFDGPVFQALLTEEEILFRSLFEQALRRRDKRGLGVAAS